MEEKLQHVQRIIDELTDAQFAKEFLSFFGAHQAMRLVGWAVLWGVMGIENTPEYRETLRQQGLSRVTVYRAAVDFRRFGEYLEDKYHWHVTPEEMVRRIKAVGPEMVIS